MTKVMRTHGLRHIISSKMILHFFCVSYVWEPTKHWDEVKANRRDTLLRAWDGNRLLGYACVVRHDTPNILLKRMRLADLFVVRDEPEIIRSLLHAAYQHALREGVSMFEIVGFPARIRKLIEADSPFRLVDEGYPFLYSVVDKSLESALASAESWYAGLYDGEGSLWSSDTNLIAE